MKRLTALSFSLAVAMVSCFNPSSIEKKPEIQKANMINETTPTTPTADSKFYTFKMKDIDGKEIAFEQYKGKKVIILNTASECGYTPQYKDWQAFHLANKDKVVVLGFPCNQFGGQEPGSSKEIKGFCEKNYSVTFQLFEKVNVKGADKSPLYQWLTDKTQNGWNEKEPTWNFCKYLINEKGELQQFFASGIKPDNAEFAAALAK